MSAEFLGLLISMIVLFVFLWAANEDHKAKLHRAEKRIADLEIRVSHLEDKLCPPPRVAGGRLVAWQE
jgi:hypothetical protein